MLYILGQPETDTGPLATRRGGQQGDGGGRRRDAAHSCVHGKLCRVLGHRDPLVTGGFRNSFECMVHRDTYCGGGGLNTKLFMFIFS